MLLQEYCAGVGIGIEMLMHGGECVAIFQHRRLKELPYTGGFSVTAVAERPNRELVEQSLSLLRALEWEGPAMVEFKVNSTNGSAVLMEVNGRYWGTISLPMAAGVNFPLYHWQLAHGERPIVTEDYDVGLQWRWTAGHVLRIHGLLIEARRSRSARDELLGYVQSLARLDYSTQDAIMTASDPMPAIFDVLASLKYCCVYDLTALRRRLPSSRVRKEEIGLRGNKVSAS
jgi:predicted ATP-grasp superfamily ATP-dependent carboligase